jgi:hypothetical protein
LATPFSTITAATRGSIAAASTATPPPRLEPQSAIAPASTSGRAAI